MFPIIVLEGADCSGKTTLARKLVNISGGHYMHLTYRWPEKMFEYQLAAVHRAVKLSKTMPVIIDRLWVSEAIYAKVYRGGSPWPYTGRCLDRILKRYGVLYVGCIRKRDAHLAHFDYEKKRRNEMYSDITAVVDEYISWSKKMDGAFDYAQYDLDVDGVDLTEAAQNIYFQACDNISFIHNYFLMSDKQYFAGRFDDCNTHRLLFLGSNLGKYKRANYPYVGYKEVGYNEFNQSLEELNLNEENLLYADVRDSEDRQTISTYIYDNPRTKVVQIGELSTNLANWIDIDYRIKSPSSLRGVFEGQKIFQNKLKSIADKELNNG